MVSEHSTLADLFERPRQPSSSGLTLNVRSVPLPGARCLLAAVVRDQEGEPTELIIATAFEADAANVLRTLCAGVSVPASAAQGLIGALQDLMEG